MTEILDRPRAATLPERVPAWGVAVDLTPREIVQGRQTKVVQRLVVLALVVVLLACGGLATMAFGDRSAAQNDFDAAQAQTRQLQAAAHAYDDLVAAQRVTQQTTSQAASLLGQDVDFVRLIARIRAVLPADVTIGSIAVLLSPATGAGTADTGAGVPIGTITISGGGSRIKALAPFVASLNHMKGVTDVVPTSTTETANGMVYALTMSFTDVLYTHRYSATTTDTTTDTTTAGAR